MNSSKKRDKAKYFVKYLFRSGIEDEKEVLKLAEEAGHDIDTVKEIMIHDFGLDPEIIESL